MDLLYQLASLHLTGGERTDSFGDEEPAGDDDVEDDPDDEEDEEDDDFDSPDDSE